MVPAILSWQSDCLCPFARGSRTVGLVDSCRRSTSAIKSISSADCEQMRTTLVGVNVSPTDVVAPSKVSNELKELWELENTLARFILHGEGEEQD